MVLFSRCSLRLRASSQALVTVIATHTGILTVMEDIAISRGDILLTTTQGIHMDDGLLGEVAIHMAFQVMAQVSIADIQIP